MARAQTQTLLPLDRFTEIVSYSPMLFNQVYMPDIQPDSSCSDPVLQYTWQPRSGGRPGREEIAQAIQQAEQMLESVLKFSPAPRWYVDDSVIPASLHSSRYPYSMGFRANAFHIIQGGVEAWSVIAAGASVAYGDVDGDGYDELATVTVSTTATDPNEIAVYYPGQDHDPAWEIRPVKVSIDTDLDTATITFKRHQAVLPDLLERLDASGVLGTNDANFLTTVDVYRHYNDPSQMGIVEWSPGICDATGCQVSAQTGCLTVQDSRNGLLSLHAAAWDADEASWVHACPTWWRTPTRVRLWYRAGLRDLRKTRYMHDMHTELERAITFLALSYMDREWLTCEQIRNLQAHWRTDLAVRVSTQAQSTSYNVSRQLLDNPLGTTRAAVYAWRVVQHLLVGEAVLSR